MSDGAVDRRPAAPRAHPSDDELADRAAGVLAEPRAEAVTAHVAGCDRCTDLLARAQALGAALDGLGAADRAVEAALARLPVPAPTDATSPAPVVPPEAPPREDPAGGDTAPADPPRAQVPVPTPAPPRARPHGSVAPVLPDGEARALPARRALPDLALAAVLLVLAGLGGVLLLGVLGDGLGGGDEESSSADVADGGSGASGGGGDTSAGGSSASVPTTLETGTDYDQELLAAAAPALAAGEPPGGDQVASAAEQGAADEAAPAEGSDRAEGAAGTSSGPTDLSVLDGLRDPAALQDCLASLDPAREAVAVDYALYEGRPAVVVVYPGREDDGFDVVVVGPRCGDELRLFLRVPPG